MNTAVSTRTQAETLIAELDRVAATKEFQQVALVTDFGLVFSWQKHKLWNLEGVLARDSKPLGLMGLTEAKNEPGQKVTATFWTLEHDCQSFLNMLLSDSPGLALLVLHPDEEDVGETFDFSPTGRKRIASTTSKQ